jgi:hypothetical protein
MGPMGPGMDGLGMMVPAAWKVSAAWLDRLAPWVPTARAAPRSHDERIYWGHGRTAGRDDGTEGPKRPHEHGPGWTHEYGHWRPHVHGYRRPHESAVQRVTVGPWGLTAIWSARWDTWAWVWTARCQCPRWVVHQWPCPGLCLVPVWARAMGPMCSMAGPMGGLSIFSTGMTIYSAESCLFKGTIAPD